MKDAPAYAVGERLESSAPPEGHPYRDRHALPAARVGSSVALRAAALGAVAVGAIALGAVAIGALAIGRLAVRSARIGRLEIDELVVREQTTLGSARPMKSGLQAMGATEEVGARR